MSLGRGNSNSNTRGSIPPRSGPNGISKIADLSLEPRPALSESNSKKTGQDFLQICQWNARSLSSSEKISYVTELPGDLIGLQEVWSPSTLVLRSLNLLAVTRENSRGGGSAITVRNPRLWIAQEVLRFEDSIIVKIVLEPKSYFYFGSCYVSPSNFYGFRNLMNLIYSNTSRSLIDRLILIGDWNKPRGILDSEIVSVLRKVGLKAVQTNNPTRGDSFLDLLFHGKDIIVKDSLCMSSVTDHLAVSWFVLINQPDRCERRFYLPNRRIQDEISLYTLFDNRPLTLSISSALKSWKKLGLKARMWPKKPKVWSSFFEYISSSKDLPFKELEKLYWQSTIDKILDRRPSNPKGFFGFLKSVYRYNADKRESGLITKLELSDGKITCDKDLIDLELASFLKEIQVDNAWPTLSPNPFPSLPALRDDYLFELLSLVNSGKASAWDAFSDIWFSKTYRDLAAFRWSCL